MDDQQKRDFQMVIAVFVTGVIVTLLVPAVFHLIF